MATFWNGCYWHLGSASFLALSGAIASRDCAHAQVTPDVTLGAESSVVTPINVNGIPSDQIDGGLERGANLFHSFDVFSVPTGSEAYFNNAPDIQNIFSRVTGGSISNIDGLLRANASANLFVLNPNGIIFGPNARLSIGGSFVGSTASAVNFADGTSFSASAPTTTPLLTVSVPQGLQYGANPRSIQVQGNGEGLRAFDDPIIDTTVGLRVEPNQTLAMVGGDVVLSGGTLKTAGGRIELGSVAGPGLVNLTPIDSGWALGYQGVPTFGDIQLSGAATVDASGAGGGDIQVQGRRIMLTNGSQIEASTLGAEPEGTLTVKALESVEVSGESADGQFSSALAAQVYPGATGNGGNLTVETGRLNVRDGAQVAASTFGTGDGGTLIVTASDVVEVIGRSADGRFASGLFAITRGDGNAGDLTIATGRLTVQGGARISARTLGTGAGGTLSVTASDVVEVIGTSADGRAVSGLFADTRGDGNAGDLTIATGRLTVQGGAQVAVVNSLGSGNAGLLRVEAGSLLLENFGNLLASTASGEGGNIDLQIQDLILIRANSLISAEAEGTGNGGNITINAPFIVAVPSENSDIVARAVQGRGGNIDITAQGIYGLEYRSSLTSKSDINATGGRPELSGTVEINTPDVDPTQGLVELPAELVDASNQIATGCSTAGENEFIITGRGGLPPNPRRVLNSNAVQVDWVELDADAENRASVERGARRQGSSPNTESKTVDVNRPPTEIVEAQGWIVDANGNVTLVATAPTAPIDIPWLPSSDCHAPKTSS